MKRFLDYSENNYGKKPRITTEENRRRLCSWQVPAIKKHFGSLDGVVFLDIGAGDIVLGERQNELGRPRIFYAQDLSEPSLVSGLERLKGRGVDTSNITPLFSDNFDFGEIEDGTVDFAFSNSLFSHLTLNSIRFCLQRLRPKMKNGKSYLSSMIIVPGDVEPDLYDWAKKTDIKSNPVSYALKNPFHYTECLVRTVLAYRTGFEVIAIHPYGHPFQRLVEFSASS
jgi:hypothetical protein